MKATKNRHHFVSQQMHPAAKSVGTGRKWGLALVLLGAVVLLGLVLFLTQKPTAGKAFFAEKEGTVGIGNVAPVKVGEEFPMTVWAYTQASQETVSASFKLDLPGGVSCVKVESMLPWDQAGAEGSVLPVMLCEEKSVTFASHTIDYRSARSGKFEVAKITLAATASGEKIFNLKDVKLYNLADQAVITLELVKDATVEVTQCGNALKETGESCLTCPTDAACAEGTVCSAEGACVPKEAEIACGNNLLETGETCDDGNIVDGDGCSKDCQLEPGWACPKGHCEKICEDSDPEEDVYVKGIISGWVGQDPFVTQDYCTDYASFKDTFDPALVVGQLDERASYVAQPYCDGSKIKLKGFYKCPESCAEGICVSYPMPAAVVCGNGLVEAGEECDDGNVRDKDGCSALCTKEVTPTNVCTKDTDCSGCLSCINGACVRQDLSNYPDMFVMDGVFNGYFVAGEKAPAIDNLAMTDIAAGMKDSAGRTVTIVDASKLDSEIADVWAQNLIVIGKPCVNNVAKEILGTSGNCIESFAPPGEGKIILYHNKDTGKWAMIVAGDAGTDDRLAAKVIAHRWKELSGWEVKVEGTTYTDATITSVSDTCPEIIASTACQESWSCDVWSACAEGKQSRTCTDANACGTTVSKPETSRSCTACSTTSLDLCTSKADCDSVNGVWDGAKCTLETPKLTAIKIEVIDPSTSLAIAEATTTASPNKEYTIKVTVTPLTTALPQNHLTIVQVDYGGAVKSFLYVNKPSLEINNKEVIEFNHKSEASGKMKITAYVWGDWPASGPGNYLLDKAEKEYDLG